MSLYAFLGTLEIGLIYGLVAMGVYLTFRILDFPDLTVDGSFTLGAAVTATLIVTGFNPYLSTLFGTLAAAVSVVDCPIPAGRKNPVLVQCGGDLAISHA